MQPKTQLDLLLIEDDDDDVFVLNRTLATQPEREKYRITRCETFAGATGILTETKIDIILLDLTLPDATGLEALKNLHTRFPRVPIVVLTGLDSEDVALEALGYGAQDYLVKGKNFDLLPRAVSYAVERSRVLEELEEARERANDAARAKGAFLANMSHEIRTPLTSILGYAEIAEGDNLSTMQRNALRSIQRNSEHLMNVINDILDLSKIDAGKLDIKPAPVPLRATIEECGRTMRIKAAEKRISLEVHYVPPLPETILTDRTRLKQILFNIIGNAIKFTDDGGVLVEVSCDAAAEILTCKVRDTGIGLTPDEKSRLFQAFSQADTSKTREFGGTGLGLIISKQLAERLGGSIALESKKGEGSTFTVTIATGPLDGVKSAGAAAALAKAREALAPKTDAVPRFEGRILLAEDCDDTRDLVLTTIRRTGAEVVSAANGKEAVTAAQRMKFDLILMDVHMPVMDGYSAVQELRRLGNRTPIVAFTASVVNDGGAKSHELGCDGFMMKPFRRSELYRVIAMYLRSPGGRAVVTTPDELERAWSDILSTEPHLAPAILRFVKNLPDRIRALEKAHEDENWAMLSQDAHKLCSATSFGYPALGKLARELKTAATKRSAQNVSRSLEGLRAECNRVSATRTQIEALVPH